MSDMHNVLANNPSNITTAPAPTSSHLSILHNRVTFAPFFFRLSSFPTVYPALPILLLHRLSSSSVALLLLVILGTVLSIRYAFLWYTFQRNRGPETGHRLPPTYPSFLPRYGTGLTYLSGPAQFINITLRKAARHGLIRAKTLDLNLIFVFEPRNVVELLQDAASAMPMTHWYVMRYLCGMPDKAGQRVWDDDSGFKDAPNTVSQIEPAHRVDLLLHQVLVEFLRGSNVEKIFERYAENLKTHMERLDVGDEWIEGADFFEWITLHTTQVLLDTICGPYMNEHCPTFAPTIWQYNNHVPTMLKGVPRWLAPKPHRMRDSLLSDLKKWHRHASKEERKMGPGDHTDGTFDPNWGTKFFRDRNAKYSAVPGFDADALASSDMAVLWGATANTFTSAFWAVYETFSDTSLLSRVRAEATTALSPPSSSSTNLTFDHAALLHLPLHQSIYAEILRQRIIIYIFRCKAETPTQIGPWSIPPRTPMVASSSALHFDSATWNEGSSGEHPITDFWADRFLTWPDDPMSGPQRKQRVAENIAPPKLPSQPQQPTFDMQGMAANGSWIPYGGRPRGCFGRHLAKREILLIIATMALELDVEFLKKDKVESSEEDFGLGAQRPKEKIPFRMRRCRSKRTEMEMETSMGGYP